jgi:hypothetical protein
LVTTKTEIDNAGLLDMNYLTGGAMKGYFTHEEAKQNPKLNILPLMNQIAETKMRNGQ